MVSGQLAAADLAVWCDLTGNELVRAELDGNATRLVLRKDDLGRSSTVYEEEVPR